MKRLICVAALVTVGACGRSGYAATPSKASRRRRQSRSRSATVSTRTPSCFLSCCRRATNTTSDQPVASDTGPMSLCSTARATFRSRRITNTQGSSGHSTKDMRSRPIARRGDDLEVYAKNRRAATTCGSASSEARTTTGASLLLRPMTGAGESTPGRRSLEPNQYRSPASRRHPDDLNA